MPEFATTSWSLIAKAAGAKEIPNNARPALERLCKTYWPPLFAYASRVTRTVQDAEDLTQAFLAGLLDGTLFSAACRERGRFRTFLLHAFHRFLQHHWERERALKRGGGKILLSLDYAVDADRDAFQPVETDTPERNFQRQWALTALDQVLRSLEAEQLAEGNRERFELLRPCLSGEEPAGGYAAAAERLGISDAAVRMAASRLRKRYREILRTQIGETVADPSEIDDEIQLLIAAIRPG